jgi:uncharacterized protein (TIGR02145 family)
MRSRDKLFQGIIFLLIPLFLLHIDANAEKKKKGKKAKSTEIASVRFGNQLWTTKNLNVDRFRYVAPIPQARTQDEWIRAALDKKPAWCYYQNDPINGAKYGKLYNWYAVNDKRGLAPKGWRIPTTEDWYFLSLKDNPRKTWKLNPDDWESEEEYDDDEAEDESGEVNERRNKQKLARNNFNAVPSGVKGWLGEFNGIGSYAVWWSSTEDNDTNAWVCKLYPDHWGSSRNIERDSNSKRMGYAVRCVQDSIEPKKDDKSAE